MNKEVSGEASGTPFALVHPHGVGQAQAVETVSRPGATSAGTKDFADRNEIFSRLVEGDSDIAGLVAYSIYKQNKLDWLTAFEAAKARAPDDAELSSYIIGEGTPRRLATYRQLAEATLATQPVLGGGRPGRAGGNRSALTPGRLATYAVVAMLFVVGFWLAAHLTLGR